MIVPQQLLSFLTLQAESSAGSRFSSRPLLHSDFSTLSAVVYKVPQFTVFFLYINKLHFPTFLCHRFPGAQGIWLISQRMSIPMGSSNSNSSRSRRSSGICVVGPFHPRPIALLEFESAAEPLAWHGDKKVLIPLKHKTNKKPVMM